MFTLRDYQAAAVAAVDRLDGRAQIIAGCGTGKTLMAIHAVAKLLAGAPGTVVLTFPTLGLLEQTYQVWRTEAPFTFSALAVCSQHIVDTEDIASDELSVDNTTSAEQLAQWMSTTTTAIRVVFATYQSVGVLATAHATYGTAPFTVMVCDFSSRANAVRHVRQHGEMRLCHTPRRYCSRHPMRVTESGRVKGGGCTRERRAHRRTVASMDNPDLYGRQVFTLPTREAIDRGILSPFRVAVIAVADSTVAAAIKDLRLIRLANGHKDSARADHVAAAIALTQAARDYQLSSVLAFHNTIAASQDFATTFTHTHALLRARGLDGNRTATITHIDGSSPLRERKAAAEDILGHHHPDRWNIVTNARCITEGIDIPALDAVFFAEPRSSDVDDTLDAESVINISQFKKARQVLTALQTHDPTITADLTRLHRTIADPLNQDRPVIETDLVDLVVPTDLPTALAEKFLRAFSIHTVETLTQQFEENFAALVAYTEEHGHASPPQQYCTTSEISLGQWVSGQRRAYQRNRMPASRIQRFEELPGWAWDARDARWETALAQLTAYAETHGHSHPPRTTHKFLNHWVLTQRRPETRERMPEARRKRLEDLPGWTWASRRTPVWETHFDALAAYSAKHGHASPPADYVTDDGIALGQWVRELRRPTRRTRLAADRHDRLESLPGWSWTYDPRRTWEESFALLADFAAEHGHAAPPKTTRHRDHPIGEWVNEQRHKQSQGRLDAARAARLETLPGWAWTVSDVRWETNFAALAAYATHHGHIDPPPTLQSDNGSVVAHWVRTVRRAARAGQLTPDRLARMEALPGWSIAPRRRDNGAWDQVFDELLTYVSDHGHASPPQRYCTPTGTALGIWVSNQRKARRDGSMARRQPDRAARLESLPGWHWNSFDALWENAFRELQAFYAETGAANPSKKYVADSGHRLGQWSQDQRRNYRRGQLDDHRARRLESLPGWKWDVAAASERLEQP